MTNALRIVVVAILGAVTAWLVGDLTVALATVLAIVVWVTAEQAERAAAETQAAVAEILTQIAHGRPL